MNPNAAVNSTGLRYWMERVLEECDNAATDFSADPVHDLRVSLRRCRSLADGMMAMDPDRDWKAMKRAGKALFQRLGNLRDVQIMMEWIEKLDVAREVAPVAAPEQPAILAIEPSIAPQTKDPADALVEILKSREAEHKHEARAALEAFDRKQWQKWSRTLPQRAARVRPGSAVFKHLALERWTDARQLHVTAMRNRSQVALHTLRIGIKRFRYIVENFLPEEHKLWSNDLKHMQDLLGDVHDLDVLWATALSTHAFQDEASRKEWHSRIVEERTKRVDKYREKTVGPDSLWNVWRAGLPQGKQIKDIATQRMKLWAKALDPDFAHSERVAQLALELYDGLTSAGMFRSRPALAESIGTDEEARSVLYAAAVMHDVGMAEGKKKHHKESQELIQKHGTPLGWKPESMKQAALVARFHCGALPRRGHKQLRDLLADEQKLVIRLSAILRLANALDDEHDGKVLRVTIVNPEPAAARNNGFRQKPALLAHDQALIIDAEGYADGTATAQAVAAERYLLETVLRRPVFVRPASGSPLPVIGARASR